MKFEVKLATSSRNFEFKCARLTYFDFKAYARGQYLSRPQGPIKYIEGLITITITITIATVITVITVIIIILLLPLPLPLLLLPPPPPPLPPPPPPPPPNVILALIFHGLWGINQLILHQF